MRTKFVVFIVFFFTTFCAIADEDITNNPNFTTLMMSDLLHECPPGWLGLLGITKNECTARLGKAKSKCIVEIIGDKSNKIDEKDHQKYLSHYNFCQIFSIMGCKYDQIEFEEFFSLIDGIESSQDGRPSEKEINMGKKFFSKVCPILVNAGSNNR